MLRVGSLIWSLVMVMLILGGLHSAAWGDFVHPGIYHNAADLTFMRQKIAARAEPWLSGWMKLQADPHAQVTWSPHAVAAWDANADSYMHGDAMAVYSHALEWALTGNQVHADKAIELLNAWSSTFKSISGQTSQEMLVCSWNACYLANAAELLVYGGIPGGKPSGWAPADIERCKKMLRYMYDVMKDFKPTFNGNWDASMMNSIACIGVFCDDQAMFDHAVDHFHGKYTSDNPRAARNGHLLGYILPSGQCQESGRDQGHVQMGLGNYVCLCEVAWKQGLDLYGAENNRLLAGLEYTAKYMLGEEVPFEVAPGTRWTKISDSHRGSYYPIWEAAYQHYVFRKGLEMPYVKRIIFGTNVALPGRPGQGSYRPEGTFPLGGTCWGTLTMFKGAEEPKASKP